MEKSSIPCAGAVWTHPVPASVVTWSAWRSLDFLSMNGWIKSISSNSWPFTVEIFLTSIPHLSEHDSIIESAIIWWELSILISVYSKSGLIHTATFDGIVHGVVVHITKEIDSFSEKPKTVFTLSMLSSSTLKATSIDLETLSWYSTSASAKADPQSWHQWTGFSPFWRWSASYILPKALIASASKVESKLLYGLSHSPNTPSLIKSFFWFSIWVSAYSLQASWKLFLSWTSSLLFPCFFSIFSSIGNPWQSHPGTYGAFFPRNVFDLIVISLSILFTECPRWIEPLAYGGPSCRIKVSSFLWSSLNFL